MSSDLKINDLVNNALSELDLALSETLNSNEDYSLGKLGRSIGLLREFQEPIFERNPDLRPASSLDSEVEPSLTQEQEYKVSKLTQNELKEIDDELLSLCTNTFQKVAKIVGTYMSTSSNKFELVDIFYAQRIEVMALSNILEHQGNLKFMRYSEVRLAKT